MSIYKTVQDTSQNDFLLKKVTIQDRQDRRFQLFYRKNSIREKKSEVTVL